MIAIITDTIKSNLCNENYRLYLFVDTNRKATKQYRKIRKYTKGRKMYFKIGVKDNDTIKELCYAIANVFAEYKEPIHIYIESKCIVR